MLCQEGVETFKAFCGPAPEMGMKSFEKLCRDCGLIDQTLTIRDVDLIFAKVVPKGQRRISLQKFEDALRRVADKKGTEACDVCRAVEQSSGPIFRSTKAESVRFHDDRSTYTGTHAHGGPRIGPKGTGSATCDGWLSSLRLGGFASQPDGNPQDGSPDSLQRTSVSGRDGAVSSSGEVLAVCLWEASIEEVFRFYCGGQPSMDGKSFLKLCRDSQLNDRCLTTTELDLIFTKVVPKGHRRIDLRCFHHALWHIAEKKGVDVQAVCSHIALLGSNGPILHGTKAETVRFHDDRTTYTGTHVHGGPDVAKTKVSASDAWLTSLRPEASCEPQRRSSATLLSNPPSPRHHIGDNSVHRRSVSPRRSTREGYPVETSLHGTSASAASPRAARLRASQQPARAQPAVVLPGRAIARSGTARPGRKLDCSDHSDDFASRLAQAMLADAVLGEIDSTR